MPSFPGALAKVRVGRGRRWGEEIVGRGWRKASGGTRGGGEEGGGRRAGGRGEDGEKKARDQREEGFLFFLVSRVKGGGRVPGSGWHAPGQR